jgi:hypothetical protein
VGRESKLVQPGHAGLLARDGGIKLDPGSRFSKEADEDQGVRDTVEPDRLPRKVERPSKEGDLPGNKANEPYLGPRDTHRPEANAIAIERHGPERHRLTGPKGSARLRQETGRTVAGHAGHHYVVALDHEGHAVGDATPVSEPQSKDPRGIRADHEPIPPDLPHVREQDDLTGAAPIHNEPPLIENDSHTQRAKRLDGEPRASHGREQEREGEATLAKHGYQPKLAKHVYQPNSVQKHRDEDCGGRDQGPPDSRAVNGTLQAQMGVPILRVPSAIGRSQLVSVLHA